MPYVIWLPSTSQMSSSTIFTFIYFLSKKSSLRMCFVHALFWHEECSCEQSKIPTVRKLLLQSFHSPHLSIPPFFFFLKKHDKLKINSLVCHSRLTPILISMIISSKKTSHWPVLIQQPHLPYSTLDAIARYHRLGGLKNRHLFLKILEAGKF